jgi:hypothetical protein
MMEQEQETKQMNTQQLSGPKKEVASADSMTKAVISNKLFYQSPPLISLFNSRQYVKYPSQSQTYTPGKNVIVNLSNSEIFVNAKNSYVQFDLNIDEGENKAATVADPWSDCSSIFERVRFIHASGVELAHHKNANGFASVRNKLHREPEWTKNQGAMSGYNKAYTQAGGPHRIAVPLSQICSVFRPLDDNLIPPFLLSSSRLEFNLEAANDAFKWAALGGTYTISNVEVVLDSYVLSDAAFSLLESMSAAGRVEYTCEDYEDIEQTETTTKLDLNLQKSIGRAFETVTVVTPTNVAATESNFTPVASSTLQSYQHRVNSLYMPALPCEGNAEKYMQVLQVKDNSIYQYAGEDALGAFVGSALIVQNLQRNDFVGVTSGLPINSSSSLRLAVRFNADANRKAVMYTSYMKIIKPYLYDKIVISV